MTASSLSIRESSRSFRIKRGNRISFLLCFVFGLIKVWMIELVFYESTVTVPSNPLQTRSALLAVVAYLLSLSTSESPDFNVSNRNEQPYTS